MYNLLEQNKNYRKATGSLLNYYRYEQSNPDSNSESFKYEIFTGNTYNVSATIAGYDGNQIPNPNYVAAKISKNETKVVVLLKHLRHLWRALNMPLINFEIKLILIWSKNVFWQCVLQIIDQQN